MAHPSKLIGPRDQPTGCNGKSLTMMNVTTLTSFTPRVSAPMTSTSLTRLVGQSARVPTLMGSRLSPPMQIQVNYATRTNQRSKSAAFTHQKPTPLPEKRCWGQRFQAFTENCKLAQGVQQKWQSWFSDPAQRHVNGLKEANWEEYPMSQIRTQHTAVVGPHGADVATDFSLLQGYLQQYKTLHHDSAGGFAVLAVMAGFLSLAPGVMMLAEYGCWNYLMLAVPLNLPLWYRYWYHSARHNQVSLKLVTVEHQLKNHSVKPAPFNPTEPAPLKPSPAKPASPKSKSTETKMASA
jgi:hypothetical protein